MNANSVNLNAQLAVLWILAVNAKAVTIYLAKSAMHAPILAQLALQQMFVLNARMDFTQIRMIANNA